MKILKSNLTVPVAAFIELSATPIDVAVATFMKALPLPHKEMLPRVRGNEAHSTTKWRVPANKSKTVFNFLKNLGIGKVKYNQVLGIVYYNKDTATTTMEVMYLETYGLLIVDLLNINHEHPSSVQTSTSESVVASLAKYKELKAKYDKLFDRSQKLSDALLEKNTPEQKKVIKDKMKKIDAAMEALQAPMSAEKPAGLKGGAPTGRGFKPTPGGKRHTSGSDEDLENAKRRIENYLKEAKTDLKKAKTPKAKSDAQGRIEYWTKARSNAAAHM